MKNTPLRQARRQRDLSLYEVAAAASSTASHLSNIETGKARASAELAARLVAFLAIPGLSELQVLYPERYPCPEVDHA